jgi:peptidoglycan/xylan/chitin deacetylase (PgdA/CDA1 family)
MREPGPWPAWRDLPSSFARLLALAALASLAVLGACGTPLPLPGKGVPQHPPAVEPVALEPAAGRVLGRDARVLVYLPGAADTYASIADRFLGGSDLAWQVAEANPDSSQARPGEPLIVPLVPVHPLGVSSSGVQGVTVLCYHRIDGGRGKVTVSPEQFEAQLGWLLANDYHVVRLSDLERFLAGREALPRRSVVLTFDDGYESVFRNAFPLLKRYGLPAAIFVYTDFIGTRDGLSWADLEAMLRSGLVDIQAHSKTHVNLAELARDASGTAYRERVDSELGQPRTLIERRLGAAGAEVRDFAYPYGEANPAVLEAMRRHGYALGLTVTPGSNPFYAAPLMLRRVMIFGGLDLEDFRRRLQDGRTGPVAP